MENTLVDESQRQSKEYGSASKSRHEKYSGMIIGAMVCHVSLVHLLLACTVPLWSKLVSYSDEMTLQCWILAVFFSSGIYHQISFKRVEFKTNLFAMVWI